MVSYGLAESYGFRGLLYGGFMFSVVVLCCECQRVLYLTPASTKFDIYLHALTEVHCQHCRGNRWILTIDDISERKSDQGGFICLKESKIILP